MIKTLLAISAGGALGAVARHGVNVLSLKLMGSAFPWGTLAVNVMGSFIMGLLIAIFAHFWQPSHEVKLFLITGLLGAFTTFSTFSLDVATLWERSAYLPVAGYVLASVVLSISALFAAMFMVRSFLP